MKIRKLNKRNLLKRRKYYLSSYSQYVINWKDVPDFDTTNYSTLTSMTIVENWIMTDNTEKLKAEDLTKLKDLIMSQPVTPKHYICGADFMSGLTNGEINYTCSIDMVTNEIRPLQEI